MTVSRSTSGRRHTLTACSSRGRFLSSSSSLRREPHAIGVERGTQIEEIGEGLAREPPDGGASVRADLDEPLGLEPRQSRPQGVAADGMFRRELCFDEPLADGVAPLEDAFADVPGNHVDDSFRFESCRFRRFQLHAGSMRITPFQPIASNEHGTSPSSPIRRDHDAALAHHSALPFRAKPPIPVSQAGMGS
jgi:hypothetical protein